jgi:hypothetical protein
MRATVARASAKIREVLGLKEPDDGDDPARITFALFRSLVEVDGPRVLLKCTFVNYRPNDGVWQGLHLCEWLYRDLNVLMRFSVTYSLRKQAWHFRVEFAMDLTNPADLGWLEILGKPNMKDEPGFTEEERYPSPRDVHACKLLFFFF